MAVASTPRCKRPQHSRRVMWLRRTAATRTDGDRGAARDAAAEFQPWAAAGPERNRDGQARCTVRGR